MDKFAGKTAVISGGAAGIGLNLAKTLGTQGMNIVLADIEAEPLEQARQQLGDLGIAVHAVLMDVALRQDWERTRDEALARFGQIHMLVNNAGVSGGVGAIETLDDPGWRWTIDVNLMGVVYGANVMVPVIKQQGEPGWLLNVASMAGMGGVPYAGAYTATKAAVVAMTEAWALELKDSPIHVSVLAPAFVKTRIHQSYRNRQPRYASDATPGPDVINVAKTTSKAVENGIDPDIVSQRVLEGLASGELYIFTHPDYRAVTDHRSEAVSAAFTRAGSSPLLQDVRGQGVLSFSDDA